LRVGYKNTTRSLVAANSFCAFTVREQFDDYCLRQALDAGAKLTIIDGLKDIQTDQHQVTVITSRRETFRSRFLIGADGAHSQVRRITGLFAPARTAIAVEGLLSRSHIPSSYLEQSRHMTLDFGVQPLGYGWLFPKADHVNVGLYTYLPEKSRVSRRKLAAYAKARLGSDSFRSVCGYPIATGGESYRPHHARILLVGDAAGMAEALLGGVFITLLLQDRRPQLLSITQLLTPRWRRHSAVI
ncbi:MAG: FAD-dependent monooxygenase, partial [Ketobacteraceae bacterium]|nr:FAD-dependent monooxygenase [Ketobacteraceae bacterium]